ncbi:MAG TPA: efflux RND transporter periplasmic adaptor subunit [Candidatus Baltobacteraceae bacterium]|nr:efflux RND transporter periplasmic adaptor subunit [Candidatus Baltobacteraceae bacterium]
MNRVRNLILITLGLAIIIAIPVFFSKRGPDAVAVKTAKVHRTSFVTKLPENGVVQHPRVETVPSLIGGNIGEIDVREGDRVQAGQQLATIVNPTLQSNAQSSQADYDSAAANIETARINERNARVGYEANVATARSALAEAQRIYRADVSLYANKAIPRNQVDADRAKLDQAQVQYDQAVQQLRLGAVTGYGQNSVQYAQAAAQKAQILNQANQQQLSFTRIVSPFSGIIQTLAPQANDPLTTMRVGDPVTAGQALFTIAPDTAYIVKAQVDEQDIINVHPGQQADVTGEDFPGRTLVGHVASISPVATKSSDPSSTARQVLTTIRLDRSPSFLRDGMSVDVDILTTNVPNVVVVPSAAVTKEGGKSYVYVIRNKRAVKTQVTVGASSDTQIVVKSGVAAGDTVVAEKNPLIHDGSAVTPAP